MVARVYCMLRCVEGEGWWKVTLFSLPLVMGVIYGWRGFRTSRCQILMIRIIISVIRIVCFSWIFSRRFKVHNADTPLLIITLLMVVVMMIWYFRTREGNLRIFSRFNFRNLEGNLLWSIILFWIMIWWFINFIISRCGLSICWWRWRRWWRWWSWSFWWSSCSMSSSTRANSDQFFPDHDNRMILLHVVSYSSCWIMMIIIKYQMITIDFRCEGCYPLNDGYRCQDKMCSVFDMTTKDTMRSSSSPWCSLKAPDQCLSGYQLSPESSNPIRQRKRRKKDIKRERGRERRCAINNSGHERNWKWTTGKG